MVTTKKPTKILCRGEDADRVLKLLNSDSDDMTYTFTPNKVHYLKPGEHWTPITKGKYIVAEKEAALEMAFFHRFFLPLSFYEKSIWNMSITEICVRLYYKIFPPAKSVNQLSEEVRERGEL